MKTSTYHDLKSNIDDDNTTPLNVPIGTTPTIKTTPAPSGSTLPPSPYLSPTSTSPPPVNPSPVAPVDPPSKPKQQTRGPAIVYEKSRSSQRIEERNKPKPSLTKATEDSNSPKPVGYSTEDDDEVRVRDELEPEDNELAQAAAFIATGQDPDSCEEAISSVDRDEWQTVMQSEMESITSVGTFELSRILVTGSRSVANGSTKLNTLRPVRVFLLDCHRVEIPRYFPPATSRFR